MIDDLDLHNKEYNADICIVGGGVAGICLAKALEESGLNIATATTMKDAALKVVELI